VSVLGLQALLNGGFAAVDCSWPAGVWACVHQNQVLAVQEVDERHVRQPVMPPSPPAL
jgi:hypothetical protein